MKGRIFRDKIRFDSFIDYSENKKSRKNNSFIKTNWNIADPGILLGAFYVHNSKEDIKGEIVGSLNTKFNVNNFSRMNLDLDLKEFIFMRKKISIISGGSLNRINISKGEIKNWNINLDKGATKFRSLGTGKIYDSYSINSTFNTDAEIFEIIYPEIRKSSGEIDNKIAIEGKNEKYNINLISSSNKYFLDLKAMPGIFENIKFKLSLNNDKMLIEKFSGNYAHGKIEGQGTVILDSPYPKIEIGIELLDSTIPIFRKSQFRISGKGQFLGENAPYRVTGKFNVSKGELFDEFKDYGSKNNNPFKGIQYIPQNEEKDFLDLLTLDLAITLEKDLQFKNSVGEVFFTGNVKLLGLASKFRMGGFIEQVPGTGRFYFKSSDFNLTKADVRFFPNEEEINPEVDVSALSQIAEYKVRLNILGRSKKFILDLSSEPPLAQNDILSLMALGYTADKSRQLSESDRQSLASVGIGSLLFEKLKLGQGLNSSLGLKLSVSPEFVESESGYLSGKSGEAATDSRVKTATKIKVEKKIGKNVDLSVSSTVGSEAGQKQEMNLNYNLNKNVSIQGVYEVKTSEEGENTSDPTSAGADLKFKWSFK